MFFILIMVLGCGRLRLSSMEKNAAWIMELLNSSYVRSVSEMMEGQSSDRCVLLTDAVACRVQEEIRAMDSRGALGTFKLDVVMDIARKGFISCVAYDMMVRRHPFRLEVFERYDLSNLRFHNNYNILHVAVLLEDYETFNKFFDLALLSENELRGFSYSPVELLLLFKPEDAIKNFLEKTKEKLTSDALSFCGALHISACMYYKELMKYLIDERGLSVSEQFYYFRSAGEEAGTTRFSFSVLQAMNFQLNKLLPAKYVTKNYQITSAIPMRKGIEFTISESMLFPIASIRQKVEWRMWDLSRRHFNRDEGEIEHDAKAYSNIIYLLKERGYNFRDEKGFNFEEGKYLPLITGEALWLGGEAVESLVELGMKVEDWSPRSRFFTAFNEGWSAMKHLERLWPCVRLGDITGDFLYYVRRVEKQCSASAFEVQNLKKQSKVWPNYLEFQIRFSRKFKILPRGLVKGGKTLLDLMREENFEDRFIDLAVECGFRTGEQIKRENLSASISKMLEKKRGRAKEEIERGITSRNLEGMELNQGKVEIMASSPAVERAPASIGIAKPQSEEVKQNEAYKEYISSVFRRSLEREDYEELKKVAPSVDLEGFKVDWSLSKDERIRKLLIRQGVCVDRSLILSVFKLNQLDVAKVMVRETDANKLVRSMELDELKCSASPEMARIFNLDIKLREASDSGPSSAETARGGIELELLINEEESDIEESLLANGRVVERLKKIERGEFGDVKKIEGEMWEARLVGHSEVGNIRIYYRARENKAFILAIVYKGEEQISRKLIAKMKSIDMSSRYWKPMRLK